MARRVLYSLFLTFALVASAAASSQTLSINVAATPSAISPNGDGTYDTAQLAIQYSGIWQGETNNSFVYSFAVLDGDTQTYPVNLNPLLLGGGHWSTSGSGTIAPVVIPEGPHAVRVSTILGRTLQQTGTDLSSPLNLLLQALSRLDGVNGLQEAQIELDSGSQTKLQIQLVPQTLDTNFDVLNAELLTDIRALLRSMPGGRLHTKILLVSSQSIGSVSVDTTPPTLVSALPESGSVRTEVPSGFTADFTDASQLSEFAVEGELRGFGFGATVSDITHMYTRSGYRLSTNNVPLPPADYDVLIRYSVSDELGNHSGPIETTFAVDSAPPIATFDGYYDGQILDADVESIELSGYLFDGHLARASLNGAPISPDMDHRYSLILNLMAGENQIVLEAEDSYGRQTIQFMTIYRGEPYGGVDPIVIGSRPRNGEVISANPLIIAITHRVPRGVSQISAELEIVGDFGSFVTDASTFFQVNEYQSIATLPNAPDGVYTISFVVIDLTGASSTPFEFSFVVDNLAPKIVISNAINEMVVADESITLIGRAIDATLEQVTINGTPIEFAFNGRFRYQWQLNTGSNQIHIGARDAGGKTTSMSFVVYRQLDGPPQIRVSMPSDGDNTFLSAYPNAITFFYEDPDGIDVDSIELFYGPLDGVNAPPGSNLTFPVPYLTFFKSFLRSFFLMFDPTLTSEALDDLVRQFVGAFVTPTHTDTALIVPQNVEGSFTLGIYVEDSLGNGAYKFVNWSVDIFPPVLDVNPVDAVDIIEGVYPIQIRAYDPSVFHSPLPDGRRGPSADGTPLPPGAIDVWVDGVSVVGNIEDLGNGNFQVLVNLSQGEHVIEVSVTDGFHIVQKTSHVMAYSIQQMQDMQLPNDESIRMGYAAAILDFMGRREFYGDLGTSTIQEAYHLVDLLSEGDDPKYLPLYYSLMFNPVNYNENILRGKLLANLVYLNGQRQDPRLDAQLHQVYVNGSVIEQTAYLAAARSRGDANPVRTDGLHTATPHLFVSYLLNKVPGLQNPKAFPVADEGSAGGTPMMMARSLSMEAPPVEISVYDAFKESIGFESIADASTGAPPPSTNALDEKLADFTAKMMPYVDDLETLATGAAQ